MTMQNSIVIVRTIRDLRDAIGAWRQEPRTIGLVPTMGALHEGHLSLVRLARRSAERVVASLFVNPRQFAAHEDLDRYPRDETGDAANLHAAGCDLLYAPCAAEIYPPGFSTSVSVSGVSDTLEGEIRPHFFGGVATVVTKLFLQTMPDLAVFGEKDYQQLLVIRRLVRDLDIPVKVIAGETVREHDGLAMSSRNQYLSAQERAIAGRLNAILRAGVAPLESGQAVSAVEAECRRLLAQAGFSPIDYVAVRAAEDLSPISSDRLDRPARLLAAAWVGKTRLIDNIAVGA